MKRTQDKVRKLYGLSNPTAIAHKLRELKEERVFRLENEKMRFYEPNGKCEEFINKVGGGKNFIILFSAANGVGKTASGANIVANIIWGETNKNKYFNLPLFKNWPDRKSVV